MNNELSELKQKLREFAESRDWDQFHSPKNLSMAICGEAGELSEIFQWLTETQSQNLTDDQLKQASQEMADILLYIIRLSDKLGVDLFKAATDKIEVNAIKYPIDKARGNAKKYDKL